MYPVLIAFPPHHTNCCLESYTAHAILNVSLWTLFLGDPIWIQIYLASVPAWMKPESWWLWEFSRREKNTYNVRTDNRHMFPSYPSPRPAHRPSRCLLSLVLTESCLQDRYFQPFNFYFWDCNVIVSFTHPFPNCYMQLCPNCRWVLGRTRVYMPGKTRGGRLYVAPGRLSSVVLSKGFQVQSRGGGGTHTSL